MSELALKTPMYELIVRRLKESLGVKTDIFGRYPSLLSTKECPWLSCFVLACTSLHVRQNSHSSVACGCGHSRVLHSWAGNISRARGMKVLRASVGGID